MLMSGVLLTIATVPSLTARVQEGAGNRYGSPLQTSGKTQSSSLGGMTRLSLPAGNEEKSVSPVHNGFSVPVSRTFMRETAGFPVIYGNIIFSEKSENKGFSIIGADGSFTPVNPEPYVGFTAVVLDNVYYSFVQTEINGETKNVMHRFSVKDGFAYLGSKVMPDGSRPEVAATDGQTVYGCFIGSNDAFYMGTLNLPTGSVTRIGDTFQWQSAAIGNDGTLYVIDYQGKLYKVDKTNANATLIGTTGALPKYYTGAAYDRRSGKIYWTVCPEDESGRLYEINTATGVATQLAKFRYNEQITGLYIPYYADAVPAAPQEMTTEFVGSNLTGKVNITVSDKNYDGAAISFPISCTVTAGDAATTEGQTITKTVQVTKAGTLSVPMTVTHDGLWRFTAWLHNTAGESPAATTKVSVGNDQPVAPQNITLEYDGSKFVLAWDSVRTSANNGWLDAEAMTYKVVRYPDDQTVAENLSVTNFTDAVAEPSGRKDYHYGVVAVCHGRVSEEGLSPIVAIGSEVMPWSHTFNTEESAQGFTILNANMDGITWGWSSQRKALYCSYNATLDMDDWVMSPGLRLEGGKVYKVTMKTSCRNVKYPEKFEAFLGKERKPEAMTMEVIPRTVIKTAYSSPLDYTGYIAIREGGTYYLGVHGCSEAGQYEAYLHDMSVSSPSDAKIPGMVEEFRVLPDSIGALGVTVSYNAPSKNMLGENLASISKIETWRDGVLIHTVTSPAPGSKISFTETLPSKSDYEYKVISYNTYGNSPEVIKSIFIGGMPYPADVKSLTAIETETAGSVKVEWPFVTTDQNGNPLDVKYVKYEIVNAKKKNRVVGTVDGNTNTFVWKALNPDDDQETIKVGAEVQVDIAIPSRNRPTNLVATDGGHKASLTWNAPAKGNNNNEVNEDFETAEACGTAVSGWTMVDGDNHAVGGFSGLELPGITPGTTKMPFFVFDNSSSDFNESFKTTSGTHFLAALYPSGTVPARDWAISPLLDGSEQTITFMAKSYSGSYREHLKVMASTAEGTDTISFTKIADYPSLSNGWTQYSVKLPAGTRRFALVSVATDALMMMIDDVHFVRALSENESKVAGYNIYRDNVLLTTVGPESCKYDDTPFKKAVYTYHVTAVYADGVESGASNSTSITMSVAGIDADSSDQPAEWYTPTGIYIGCKQPTAPGVYIRKQGDKGRKVIVK